MDDPPALPVLEYGRPPPSPWRGNVLRTCVVFGVAMVLFGCCILGGYLGHLMAPAPTYAMAIAITLPAGTTQENSPALAGAITEIMKPEVIAETLRSHGWASTENSALLAAKVSVSAPHRPKSLPIIIVEFRDKDEARAVKSGEALGSTLEAILTARGQEHGRNPSWWGGVPERMDDPMKPWFIGGGMMLAVFIPGLILWRFRKYLLPPLPPAPPSWQDHGQPG